MKKIISILFSLLFFSASAQISFEKNIYEHLSKSNSDFHFVYLGESIVGDSAIAFFWPCIINNGLTDEKIMAVVLSKESDHWEIIDLFKPADISSPSLLTKQFNLDAKLLNKGLSPGEISQEISRLMKNIQLDLSNQKFDLFKNHTKTLASYFNYSVLFYSTFFTDLIFKGYDHLDAEILSEKNQIADAVFYFKSPQNETRVESVLNRAEGGYFIKNIKPDTK